MHAPITDGATSIAQPVTEALAVRLANAEHECKEEWLTISKIEPLYGRRDGAAFRVHFTRGRLDE